MPEEKTEDPWIAKERDRLRRAQGVSNGLWAGTKWGSLPFIGVAGTTLGLSFAVSGGNWWAIGLMVVSICAGVVGGFAYLASSNIIKSRIRELDRGEKSTTSFGFVTVPIAGQLIFLIATVSLVIAAMGVAVATAMDPPSSLDDRLKARLSNLDAAIDESDPGPIEEAMTRVETFCATHYGEDRTTNAFQDVCCDIAEMDQPDRKYLKEAMKRLGEE